MIRALELLALWKSLPGVATFLWDSVRQVVSGSLSLSGKIATLTEVVWSAFLEASPWSSIVMLPSTSSGLQDEKLGLGVFKTITVSSSASILHLNVGVFATWRKVEKHE